MTPPPESTPRRVAALYVLPDGPYAGREDIDLWPESRDARLYAGPWPVVAHPPCARWGRYWSGGPSAAGRYKGGDDGGRFAAALAAVRRWGGVLEHPEASHAWRAFRLPKPPRAGGWVRGLCGGWCCCVEQGHYGHEVRKATWLLLYGNDDPPPELIWGPAAQTAKCDLGYHSTDERRRAVASGAVEPCRLSKRQRELTPEPFADQLIGLARSAWPT